MQPLLHIAHGDIRPAKRRTRQTGGNNADLSMRLIGQVDDNGALARRRALLDREPDAALRERLRGRSYLGEDCGRAVEGCGGGVAAVFADDPAQGCGGGCLGGGDVVAVEAHACFEAEGVASGEAGEADLVGAGEEEVGDFGGERRRAFRWDGDLEAVFAGVACAGDEEGVRGLGAVGQSEVHRAALAEVQSAQVGFRGGGALGVDEGLEHGGRERALQRHQGTVREDVPFNAVRAIGLPVGVDFRLQESEVLFPTGSVGDKVERVWPAAGDDAVINDTASSIFK